MSRVTVRRSADSAHALNALDAKLLGPPRQEFVELRLGGPDNLVLQHLDQPIDRGIADYGLEHPIVLVLQSTNIENGCSPS